MPDTSYTLKQVSEHNSAQDCWMVIDEQVYDLGSYLSDHLRFLDIKDWCGKDASLDYHSKDGKNRDHSATADALLENYLIGNLISSDQETSIAVNEQAETLNNQPIFKTGTYNVWLPLILTVVACLVSNKLLSKTRHNFIWNTILLLGLLPSVVLGFLLALNLVSKAWLVTHVELSIVFGTACVMHLILRLKTYIFQGKTSLKK